MASIAHSHAAADPDALTRRLVVWVLAAWGFGGLLLGAILFEAGELLVGWARALLLVPAVAAWRASVASLLRRADRRRRALTGRNAMAGGQALMGSSQAGLSAPQLTDGLRRWRQLVPLLKAQRDRLPGALRLPPFRAPGESRAATAAPLSQTGAQAGPHA